MFEKLTYAKMMKEAFNHMKAIEEAETEDEKAKAEKEWEEWKKEHSEIIEDIKYYIAKEVIRMSKNDKKFRDVLLIKLQNMKEEEGSIG